VTFCSGKKFTADDVVYSFKRLNQRRAQGATRLARPAILKDIPRPPIPTTVEYELNEPFSDLLLNLAMFTTAIHNKESVEALGKDYGRQRRSTAPARGASTRGSRAPRSCSSATTPTSGGPSMYQNKGPVKFREAFDQDRARGFQPRRGHAWAASSTSTHQIPLQFIQQVKARAQPQRPGGEAQLPADVLRLTRRRGPWWPTSACAEAMNIAINRADITKGIMLGQRRSGLHTFIDPKALDFADSTRNIIKEDAERAKKLLDEAGWKMGADGIREKDGVKLAPAGAVHAGRLLSPRVSEAIQGYMRKDRHRLADRGLRLHDRPGRDGQTGTTICGR